MANDIAVFMVIEAARPVISREKEKGISYVDI